MGAGGHHYCVLFAYRVLYLAALLDHLSDRTGPVRLSLIGVSLFFILFVGIFFSFFKFIFIDVAQIRLVLFMSIFVVIFIFIISPRLLLVIGKGFRFVLFLWHSSIISMLLFIDLCVH